MSTLGLIGGIAGVLIAVAGWFIESLKDAARREGAAAENVRQQQAADAARKKADAVLAEHRDPTSVDDRLRKGDF